MSREYNYGGTSLIVDSIDEIFESGAVSTKTVNNIKQIIGQQRQTKDINKLKEQIGGAAEDGTISASEKPGLSREWASLVSSYSSIADKFKNYNLTDNTLFYLLQRKYEELSPIMGEIFANMEKIFAAHYPDGYTSAHIKYHTDSPEEIAIINYTSGTSGFSKGVLIPYRALYNNMMFAKKVINIGI